MRTAQAFGSLGFFQDFLESQRIAQGIDLFDHLLHPLDPADPGPSHGLEQIPVLRVEMIAQHMDIFSFVIRIDFHPPDQFQSQMAGMDSPGGPVIGLDIVMVRNGKGCDAGNQGLGNDLFRSIDSVRKSGMDM